MRKTWFGLALVMAALAAATLGAACGGDDDDGGEGVRVVATTTQIGALVREVAGDRVQLTVLLQAGADAHDYEPSPQDSRTLKNADLVLKNGIGLDEWLDDLIKNSGTKAKVVVATEGIEPLEGEAHDDHGSEADKEKDDHGHEHGEGDPHVWHDPENVKVMVKNIAEALAEVDGENAATYRADAEAYAKKLNEVDREIRALFEPIPAAARKVVTNHESLNYFAKRYQIEIIGAIIPGTAKEAQPSAQDLAKLTDLIRSEGVKAILAEAEIDPKVAEQLAKDTGVRVVTGVYADSLGPAGSGADTVHGMLLHNARLIAEALR
ncbi:metal ABC transporter substrate-binding protein [Tepidiforma thermophila]|uniref:Zinc/manganese transport system substrate-binding protein n=1 Tax=Tepidiforma thermophila (strain KCTC 52669 / CGMCC 1.13589 / G233) TaxID=2761530 RepID=A0A2A9HGZ5_TEPT2|nr:metal ABC transporter substrate-binding protein [Tepidiforma thermophila]PFG75294.1 zinc/manganese transport system substrate-binding protein [Tepidiforma thermophila]